MEEVIKHTDDKWNIHFLKIAKLCSEMSKDPSTKVGAAIRGPDKSVMSTGYNGLPPGMNDTDSILNDRPTKYKYVIHAEENAIKFAKRHQKSLDGCILYTTLFPCDKCYSLLKESGIKKVVTLEPTPEQVERWGESWKIVKKLAIEDNISIECYKL